MAAESRQKQLMEKYLLGELSAAEKADLEESYWNDGEIFQDLVTLEDELIEEYILGELSPGRRKQFENCFLAQPGQRERVETARALLAYSDDEERVSSPPLRLTVKAWHYTWFAAAAVLLIMLAAMSWLFLSKRQMAGELARLRQEQAILHKALEQIETPQADLHQRDGDLQPGSQLLDDIVPYTLGPEISRGAGSSLVLAVPTRASYVLLRVVLLGVSRSRFDVRLETAGGIEVWRQENVQTQTREDRAGEVAVLLPARFLENRDYILKIISAGKGADLQNTLAGYSFHITRR